MTVRLDKWLWAARFYKTRILAQAAIKGGKVRYNGVKAKPSRMVQAGAELTIRQKYYEQTIIVQELSDKRGPASKAILLYEETPESIKKRGEQMELHKEERLSQVTHQGRPDKHQRKSLDKLKRGR